MTPPVQAQLRLLANIVTSKDATSLMAAEPACELKFSLLEIFSAAIAGRNFELLHVHRRDFVEVLCDRRIRLTITPTGRAVLSLVVLDTYVSSGVWDFESEMSLVFLVEAGFYLSISRRIDLLQFVTTSLLRTPSPDAAVAIRYCNVLLVASIASAIAVATSRDLMGDDESLARSGIGSFCPMQSIDIAGPILMDLTDAAIDGNRGALAWLKHASALMTKNMTKWLHKRKSGE